MKRRSLVAAPLLALAATTLAMPALDTSARAQTSYPDKPIRLIVPFSAGGPSDVLARAFAKQLGEALGQPVVVDNRVGAGGAIGIDAAVKSAPDGYTLGFAHTGTTAINPHLMARSPYDPLTELLPLTPIVSYANVLIVNSRIPATTVQEFVQWAKSHPNEAYFASGGLGATNHLSGELLKALTGMPLKHVPYRGNGPAMNDVIAGTVACMFDIPVTVVPQLKGGRVRALAVTTAKRSAELPNVPALAEVGYGQFEAPAWWAVLAPAKTPPEIVARMNAEISKALQNPDTAKKLEAQGINLIGGAPETARVFIEKQIDIWGKVVKDYGIKAD